MNRKALITLKILIAIALLMNIVTIYFIDNSLAYYQWFPYLTIKLMNSLFSLALLGLVYWSKKHFLKVLQLFNFILFVDTILVFQQNINFLIHVFMVVIFSRYLFIFGKKDKKKRKITEHLIEETR